MTETDGVTVAASDEGFANVAAERKVGRIPVLLVRMNVDLLMGEELKKTGAGNLFTVFGEPDIELHTTADGETVVELHGVDVYDPTTGEVRSNDTSKIALWMVDTNYNEEHKPRTDEVLGCAVRELRPLEPRAVVRGSVPPRR